LGVVAISAGQIRSSWFPIHCLARRESGQGLKVFQMPVLAILLKLLVLAADFFLACRQIGSEPLAAMPASFGALSKLPR